MDKESWARGIWMDLWKWAPSVKVIEFCVNTNQTVGEALNNHVYVVSL